MERFDLCVIGGGPAGYAAAMRAIDYGKKVILIEKNKLGGAGIYDGVLSSKTMWEFSRRISNVKELTKKTVDIDYTEVQKIVDRAIFDRKQQLSVHIKLLEKEAKNKLFHHKRGFGKLLSKHEVQIIGKSEKETIWAENIILATGSSPRKLPNIPIDEHTILTSDGVNNLTEFPKSMVILGAGVIGCEFAAIFSNFGKTKVYIIDKADRILPFEDQDISEVVSTRIEANGVTIHKNSNLERMEIKNGKVEYELSFKDGSTQVFTVEKALISVGRVPNTYSMGLEDVGVELSPRGHIIENNAQSTVPNIYAVGDITDHMALVNVAEMEGRHAAEVIYDTNVKDINYQNISTIMFLNPEVAGVGMNESDVTAKKIPYRLVKIDYSCISRAIAMRETTGFFKIIVTDDDEMKILGMRAVGEHASSAIQAVALLIKMDMSITELSDMIHPHPSIIEGIQEAARMLEGKSIYKASVFKDKMKCYKCVEGVCTPIRTY
jgi:dihydrolipoamide dehydrogenase